MSDDRSHDEIRELLGAYALDAVEPGEAEVVAAHLEECDECRAEVDEHRQVAAALGNSVEPLPPELWDRIAAGLGDDRPAGSEGAAPEAARPVATAPEAARPVAPAPAPAPGVPPSAAPSSNGHGADGHGRSILGRVTAVLAVAAAVAIGVLAYNLAAADHHADDLQASAGSRGLHAAITAALASSDHQVTTLRSPSGGDVGQLVLLPDGKGYLVQSSMPALSSQQTYQLWAVVGGRYISLGLLGHQPTQAAFSFTSASPTELAVTAEPAGGVAQPDRSPIATAQVTSA